MYFLLIGQAHIMASKSPTPFYSMPYLSAFTGFQQGTACNSLSQLGIFTITATFDPGVPEEGDDSILIKGSPAFVYTGNLTHWLSVVGEDGSGQSQIDMPYNLSQMLQDIPVIKSQLANFSSVSVFGVGFGAPTVLISAAEVTAPSSTIVRMPGTFPTSGTDEGSGQLTSPLSEEQTSHPITSVGSITTVTAQPMPDIPDGTAAPVFASGILTTSIIAESENGATSTTPNESAGSAPASSLSQAESTAIATIAMSQTGPAWITDSNEHMSQPLTEQSWRASSTTIGIGDIVASMLGMGLLTSSIAHPLETQQAFTESQSWTNPPPSGGADTSLLRITASPVIAAGIPAATAMSDVSTAVVGDLGQEFSTEIQTLETATSSGLLASGSTSTLHAELSESNHINSGSTVLVSSATFLYAPTGAAAEIQHEQKTTTYKPSGQSLLGQDGSPALSSQTEATSGQALILGTSSLMQQATQTGLTTQSLALTQKSSTYYLLTVSNGLVVVGTQTLSSGGPAATIGTELVSVASSAIIVNGQSTITISGSLTTSTARQKSSITQAPNAGLSMAVNGGAESSSTSDASTTAKGNSSIKSSGGWRFHEAPRRGAFSLCLFALVYESL